MFLSEPCWSRCVFFLTKDCTSKHNVIHILSSIVKYIACSISLEVLTFVKYLQMYWTHENFPLRWLNYGICIYVFNFSWHRNEIILLQLMNISIFFKFFFFWVCILLVVPYKGSILLLKKIGDRNISHLYCQPCPNFSLPTLNSATSGIYSVFPNSMHKLCCHYLPDKLNNVD